MRADTSEIDRLRQEAILSSLAGFPFLLVYSIVWTAAGALSYVVPESVAPWLYLVGGLPGAPVAIALERRLGYIRASGNDPLLPLTMQLLFVQIVSIPAVMIVWSAAPSYTPVAFAAVVGGHFLPYQWVYRTPLYGILGVAASGGAYVLGALSGEEAIHYTGFFMGVILMVGALVARAHARATWLAWQRDGTAGTR